MKIGKTAELFLSIKPSSGDIRDIRINEMAKWVKDAINLLINIEHKGQEYYYGDETINECPCCLSTEAMGHAEDCELHILLVLGHEDYTTGLNKACKTCEYWIHSTKGFTFPRDCFFIKQCEPDLDKSPRQYLKWESTDPTKEQL